MGKQRHFGGRQHGFASVTVQYELAGLAQRIVKDSWEAHLTVDETAQAQAGCLEATYADWTGGYHAD